MTRKNLFATFGIFTTIALSGCSFPWQNPEKPSNPPINGTPTVSTGSIVSEPTSTGSTASGPILNATGTISTGSLSPEPTASGSSAETGALDEKELEETMSELDTLFEEISGDSKK